MKKNYLILILLLFSVTLSIKSQTSNDLWSATSELNKKGSNKIKNTAEPLEFKLFDLNYDLLLSKLNTASKQSSKKKEKGTIVTFPNELGELKEYEVFEASIMSEGLQNKFPNLKSYIGKGVENPSLLIRFSTTSLGLSAIILNSTRGTIYIEPYTQDKKLYKIYSSKLLPQNNSFDCGFDEIKNEKKFKLKEISSKSFNFENIKFRKFRLAVTATAEYSLFHLNNQGISLTDSESIKKEAVLSAIVSTITMVTSIFERDVSLTYELVDNNDQLIFFDSDNDGLTNTDKFILIDEGQKIIDDKIGFSNYDIGHVLYGAVDLGGVAYFRSTCTDSKAGGISGSIEPQGHYFIGVVSHEMGHQFGANHTFNSEIQPCWCNRNYLTSFEPGSGSTLMGYAGQCGEHSVQNETDLYFHLGSIKEMLVNTNYSYIKCVDEFETGNNSPVISELKNYIIPKSTPFILTALAQDIDNNDLTYTWEQLDPAGAEAPPISTLTQGPTFRSLPPSSSNQRFFPKLETVLENKLANKWEVLASIGRGYRFGTMVRDNSFLGGLSAFEEMEIVVDGNSGPFKLNSQIVQETWKVGTAQIITWEVANTNMAPIKCEEVNILLSIDGGYTFPIILASKVPNNGESIVTVPENITDKGRLKIEAVENVFYAINEGSITINSANYTLSLNENKKEVCDSDEIKYSFIYNTYNGFNENVIFSGENVPEGINIIFSPQSVIQNNSTVEVLLTGLSEDNKGNHSIILKGQSLNDTTSSVIYLDYNTSQVDIPELIFPIADNLLEPTSINFQWKNNQYANNYLIELSKDKTFNNLYKSANIDENSIVLDGFEPNTTYYYRVKGISKCGESDFSNVFSFNTLTFDDDNDGITNDKDQCLNSLPEDVVNKNGCSTEPTELWGISKSTGINEDTIYGKVYKYNIEDNTISFLYPLDYWIEGKDPFDQLMIAANQKMYGLTYDGGKYGNGTLIEIDIKKKELNKIVDFQKEVNGAHPRSSLVEASNGKLYGLTEQGGTYDNGVLFEFDLNTKNLKIAHNFNKTIDGSYAYGNLVEYKNKLYGLCGIGGENEWGTIFEYDLSSGIFTKKIDMSLFENGGYARCSLILYKDNLYGVALEGGKSFLGTIFKYNSQYNEISTVFNFTNPHNGYFPTGEITLSNNGNIYGFTSGGGKYGNGVLFEFNIENSTYSNLEDMKGKTTRSFLGRPIQARDGNLYGALATREGEIDGSILYKYDFSEKKLVEMLSLPNENGLLEATTLFEVDADSDNDGVFDYVDLCLNSLDGAEVDNNGCSFGQKDDDNDGVMNDNDLCPNTTSGTNVNANGCFFLPSNNFSIEVIGETCPDKNNGKLMIMANETHSYVATINGTSYNFNINSLTVPNLAPDTYIVCLSVTGEIFEQCYTIVIAEGKTISGKASVTSNKASIAIEQGTAPYNLYVNGISVLNTLASSFTIDVKHGDLLEVKTAKSCEGVFLKSIDLFENINVYPNPSKGIFEITLPISEKEVLIELYTMGSQLISKETYQVVNGKVHINLENRPTGVYVIKINLDTPVNLTIVKE